MPYPRQLNSVRLAPLSSKIALATSVTAAATAIPNKCRAIRLVGATVKHRIGVGSASSAPTLDDTNSIVVQISGEETFYPRPKTDLYLYYQAVSATGTVDVSYYA